MKIRRTETTIETYQVLTIRTPPSIFCSGLEWCAQCVQLTRWITPDIAATLRNVSSRTIYRWVESNSVHFREVGGRVLICLNTLPLVPAEEPRDNGRTAIVSVHYEERDRREGDRLQ